MNMDFNFQPLGPDRIRERYQELRAQVGQSEPSDLGEFSGMMGAIGDGEAPVGPMRIDAAGLMIKPESAPANLKAMIDKAAGENGVDPALLDAVVAAESSYDPNCRSVAGAMGLTQLMPLTAQEVGCKNPFDPEQNLQGGAKYLSKMLSQFSNLDEAIAAYNAGPGSVRKAGGIPPYKETQNYVRRVIDLYNAKRAG